MKKSNLCDKKHPCLMCGDCCCIVVCGWAMEQRVRACNGDLTKVNINGPCEFLREQPDGRNLCGLYLALGRVTQMVMRQELHFGKGCTNPKTAGRVRLAGKLP